MAQPRGPSSGAAPTFRRLLDQEFAARGFFAWGFLDGATFRALVAERCSEPRVGTRYGLDRVEGAAVVALRYGEGNYEPPAWAAGSGPRVRLARFARADWYGEILARLGAAAAACGARASNSGSAFPPPKAWRRLSNSGLPEKSLALAAGLGCLGRNGLLIARRSAGADPAGPGYSSAVLIGLLLCPADLGPAEDVNRSTAPAVPETTAIAGAAEKDSAEAPPLGSLCGGCRSCAEACPTGALDGEGGFVRRLCLQNWTAREEIPPPEIEAGLDDRLYGCDACLEACPFFLTDPGADCGRGRLGPGLGAAAIRESGDLELKRRLKGTALGLPWMSAEGFRRSVTRALGKAAAGKSPAGGVRRA